MPPRARNRRFGATPIVLTLLGVALLVLAAVFVATRKDKHVAGVASVDRGTVPAYTSAPPARVPAATRTSHQSSSATYSHAPLAAAGAELLIPSQHVDAPVVAVNVVNQVLDVPLDPKVVGWWTGGATPGSGTGAVIIDGHINYAGVSGSLSVLPNLHPGDPVSLTHGGRSLHYRVTAVHTYAKDTGLPSDIFAQSGPERLVLITCGGAFDSSTGNYEDNIVAFADPVTS